MKNKKKAGIVIFLLLFTCIYLGVVLYQHKNAYTVKYNAPAMKRAYEKSQWMVPNSQFPISDEMLYSYAGYKYISGTNPILVNPEAPPFGKYMIGFSILAFSNEKIVNVLSGIAVLFLMYFIVRFISSSSVAASLAVMLTAVNTLFTDQLIHAPQLEILQAVWFLAFLYVFLLWEKQKKWILILFSGLFLGLFLSVKVFSYNLAFLFVIFGVYLTLNRKRLKAFLIPLALIIVISLVIFTATYLGYFIHGGTLRGFAGSQKWIFMFYRSSGIDMLKTMGSYISLIFANRWRFWSSGYPLISYNDWSILWPVIYILSLWGMVRQLRNKRMFLVLAVFLVYNAFLFITPIFPRYLLFLFLFANIIVSPVIATYLIHEKK